ncbi:MAG: phosphoribosylaminoimidazolesuccinocarboxamide synthase [Bacillota bacterium]
MQRLERLYEGKAKIVYRTDDPAVYWVQYKDDATAFNAQKRGTIEGKGALNNQIAAIFFDYLSKAGVENHFIEKASDTEMLVKALEIIPIEVIVRNIAAGSMAKRLGLEEGTDLACPVVEFCLKSDELGDPLINRSHALALRLATPEQCEYLEATALKVNELLQAMLKQLGIILVDFKLEFGLHHGRVMLGDEISPDTCRFWDAETREKLDKDRFRRDLGGVEQAYQEILSRLGKGIG